MKKTSKETSKKILRSRLALRLLPFLFLEILGCASYKLGRGDRALPGGAHRLAIPIFQNMSQEPGVEVDFTNALLQEFQQSRLVELVPESQAEVLLRGAITKISYVPGALKSAEPESVMPMGSVLATSYTIRVDVTLELVPKNGGESLWRGHFSGERAYTAPQITIPLLNSANPNYNLSARRIHIGFVANDMMFEAHDRITENF